MDPLRNNFDCLMNAWENLTKYASSYNLKTYLKMLKAFQSDVNHEVEIISRDLLLV